MLCQTPPCVNRPLRLPKALEACVIKPYPCAVPAAAVRPRSRHWSPGPAARRRLRTNGRLPRIRLIGGRPPGSVSRCGLQWKDASFRLIIAGGIPRVQIRSASLPSAPPVGLVRVDGRKPVPADSLFRRMTQRAAPVLTDPRGNRRHRPGANRGRGRRRRPRE